MYSSICENAIRRKRHNQELYALFKDVEITMYTIKLTRLRWEGYVMKKKYQEIKEKILFAQSLANRKKRKGRSKSTWRDEVHEIMEKLGITEDI